MQEQSLLNSASLFWHVFVCSCLQTLFIDAWRVMPIWLECFWWFLPNLHLTTLFPIYLKPSSAAKISFRIFGLSGGLEGSAYFSGLEVGFLEEKIVPAISAKSGQSRHDSVERWSLNNSICHGIHLLSTWKPRRLAARGLLGRMPVEMAQDQEWFPWALWVWSSGIPCLIRSFYLLKISPYFTKFHVLSCFVCKSEALDCQLIFKALPRQVWVPQCYLQL